MFVVVQTFCNKLHSAYSKMETTVCAETLWHIHCRRWQLQCAQKFGAASTNFAAEAR